MRKKRKVYRKILEKLPVKSNKRAVKVMYKYVPKNRLKAASRRYQQNISGAIRI